MMFFPLLAALNSPVPATPPVAKPTMTLFIGSYTNDTNAGISSAHFNPETGELSAPTTAAATPNPSWLALSPDGKTIFASNEWGKVADKSIGGISAFSLLPDSKLAFRNSAAFAGGPCHLTVDASGKTVFAATYGGGTVAAFNAETLAQSALIKHEGSSVNASRQKEPHAHQVVMSPDNRFVLAADLGLDKILAYALDQTGALSPAKSPFIATPAGSGPRHIAFSKDNRFLFVGGELDNTITAFRYNAADASGEKLQTLSTLPAGFEGKSSLAEVTVHPSGKFLYISNRGHDSIASYTISEDGNLSLLGHTPTEGKSPRHFIISPDGKWFLVANSESNSIVTFRIDPLTGTLEKVFVRNDIEGKPVSLLLASS
ncbi:MAG TPA: lactonase family protein [Abditibacteriaceae bacterium]|jgi:6-phosphogluconolactonase